MFMIVLHQHRRNSFYGRYEYVHLFACVVYCKRCANGARYAISVHNGLCAVVACPDGNAKFVEQRSDVVGMGIAHPPAKRYLDSARSAQERSLPLE